MVYFWVMQQNRRSSHSIISLLYLSSVERRAVADSCRGFRVSGWEHPLLNTKMHKWSQLVAERPTQPFTSWVDSRHHGKSDGLHGPPLQLHASGSADDSCGIESSFGNIRKRWVKLGIMEVETVKGMSRINNKCLIKSWARSHRGWKIWKTNAMKAGYSEHFQCVKLLSSAFARSLNAREILESFSGKHGNN